MCRLCQRFNFAVGVCLQLMQAVYTELHAYGLNMKRMQACPEVEGGKLRDAGLGCIKERLAGMHQL